MCIGAYRDAVLAKKRLLVKSLLINLFFIRLNEPSNFRVRMKSSTREDFTDLYIILFKYLLEIVSRSFTEYL